MNPSTPSPLELAALTYSQELGWPVFPIAPRGKRPLIDTGFHGASTHPEAIAEWWTRWPDANVGFSPGSMDLIVIDVDGPAGEKIARQAGVFDAETLECITSRGKHLYFQLPAGTTIGNLSRTELDVRAHNGYVLLPPSVHETGHVYRWVGRGFDDIAALPSRVLGHLTRRPERQRAPSRFTPPSGPVDAFDAMTKRRVANYTIKVGFGLADGRKTAAYQLSAFYRHDVALSDRLAWDTLAQWNATNSPPLSDDTLGEIFQNAGRYGRGAA